MSYAHCERCDTEIMHEGATHDCVQVLRLRIEALEKAFNEHWHGDWGAGYNGPFAARRQKGSAMSHTIRTRQARGAADIPGCLPA